MSDEIDDRKERMQRIRVGLTGLAVVLVIVLLATAFFTRINQQAGPASNAAAAAAAADKAGDEPLSDLGIVPRAPDNAATPANATAPAGTQR